MDVHAYLVACVLVGLICFCLIVIHEVISVAEARQLLGISDPA